MDHAESGKRSTHTHDTTELLYENNPSNTRRRLRDAALAAVAEVLPQAVC